MLTTYDKWKSTNVDDEFLGPEPEDEDELPEPTVEEMWIGWPVNYCHRVRFASGSVYSVVQSTSGGFIGDYEIHGPGNFYSDGFESAEKAIDYLTDPEKKGLVMTYIIGAVALVIFAIGSACTTTEDGVGFFGLVGVIGLVLLLWPTLGWWVLLL